MRAYARIVMTVCMLTINQLFQRRETVLECPVLAL